MAVSGWSAQVVEFAQVDHVAEFVEFAQLARSVQCPRELKLHETHSKAIQRRLGQSR
jgi:hypothetical protein